MRSFHKLKFLISSLLILVFFTSFKSANSFENYSGKDWIPEDFNPRNGTLLIQIHPYSEKYNEGMIKFLKEEYPWKFEVVAVGDALGDKYEDKKTYPFMIQWTDIITNVQHNNLTNDLANHSYQDMEGHFLDLATYKRYPDSGYGINRGQTTYKKIISVLVKKFKDG